MKKLIFPLVCLAFASSAYAAQEGSIGLSQCTTITADTVTLTCSGKELITITGDAAEFYSYTLVKSILGDVATSNCALAVGGFDKNLHPVVIDGGTVTLNMDSKTSTMSYSNPTFKPVTGLYWIAADGSLEDISGNFTLADNNTNTYFKDTTCTFSKK
jgi:hypothetical protein